MIERCMNKGKSNKPGHACLALVYFSKCTLEMRGHFFSNLKNGREMRFMRSEWKRRMHSTKYNPD